MTSQTLTPPPPISLFVKSILIFEETNPNQKTILPFFADGYPGLIFQETDNGLVVHPHNKKMPSLFLYGQTVKPIEMALDGRYKLLIFQLHPFVLGSFFNVPTNEIKDECYDLLQMENGTEIVKSLNAVDTNKRIAIITDLLYGIFMRKREMLDLTIAQSIQLIIGSKGQVSIKALCRQLHITERTFERRFVKEVGISAKQFAQINQFQQSLQQLTLKEFTKLSDVVYANGFADQSHFIRVFKAFTGRTPKKFSAGMR